MRVRRCQRLVRHARLAAASAAAALVSITGGAAEAAAPACFPERTVLESIPLRDDHSVAFGGLRAGQVVVVRDQPEAGAGTWADIEIARPIVVRGRTDRRKLVVFAREDIEAQPGLAWLSKGAPLSIVSGDDQRARVVVALSFGAPPQLPAVEVSCALLQATPPPEIEWDAVGPLRKDHDRVPGRPVEWKGTRQLESDDGARSVPLHGGAWVTDLRRKASVVAKVEAARVLVEIVDHYNWTRHRGWTGRAGLLFQRSKARDVICSCAEPAWLGLIYPPTPRVALEESVALRAITDGRPVATLPAGDTVIPLSVKEDQALVAWTAPPEGAPHPGSRQMLFGLLPARSLVALSASEVNAIVEGRLVPVPSSASSLGAIVVKARSGLVGALKAQTPLAPDGSFRLIAPINRSSLTLWAEAADGQKLSADRSVRLEIGKTVRVDLTLDAPR